MTDDETSDTGAPGEPQAAESPFGNFRRRTLETFASLLFGTLVAGLYAILTARALGPSGKGLVTVLLLLPALAALVLSGPIELANQYFGARQPETRHRLLTNSLVVSGIGGVAAALILLLVGAVGTRFGGSWLELVLTVVTIPLVTAARLVAGLILSTGRTLTYNLLTPLGQTLLLVFTAGAFLIWSSSALTVISANALAQAIAFVAVIAVARISPSRPSGRLLAECVRYGVFGFSANLVQFLNFRLDFFLLSALRSSASVGIYSIATTLAELIGRIASSAATILLPRVASGAPGGVAFTTRVARVVLLATIAAALALAAVGSFLITLFFGDAFSGAYTPLLVLLPGMAALALATILATDLAGRGAPAVLLYGSLIGLVLTCVLNPILIPLYGATGAALTSTIAYTASTVFVAVVFGRRHGTRLWDVLVPRRGDFRARAAVGPPA
jgi:O-antigen/teichoic acid export membrane protein